MVDDYYSYQSKKQRAGMPKSTSGREDAVEWRDPSSARSGSSGIAVTEHDANSTTVIRRLRRFWFDRRS